jgi:uncharacterized protein (TIGR02421 family)
MNARGGARRSPDTQELSFGPRGQLRETFGTGGRVHLDRWLPFLVLHRTDSPEQSIGRRVAVNSPAYLVWSPADDREAQATLELLLPCLEDKLGPILLIEVRDLAGQPEKEGSPQLPEFAIELSAAQSGLSEKAYEALRKRAEKITVDLRDPTISTAPSVAPLLPIAEGKERISISIPPIHRAPDGDTYPQVRHELASAVIESLLCAASAFIGAASNQPPPHFHALGRSAILAAALNADKKLDSIARSFDFLLSVTPINIAEAKSRFIDRSEDSEPDFRYRPLTVDPDLVKRDLYEVDLSILEDMLLERLLGEKRREIDMQLTMLATRNTDGFRPASMLLYGTVTGELLEQAKSLLLAIKPRRGPPAVHDAGDVASAARALVGEYQKIDPCFAPRIEVRDDVFGLLVSGDRLLIASDTSLSAERLDALLAHEVSVHLLTYFNGSTQGLKIFRTGLAHYEGIQEGLGVFAEWAVGALTPTRLRLLAGRVVAVNAMIDGASFIEIYRLLRRDFGFAKSGAFDIAARVMRSGGLAKDAIYLAGFRQIIDRVATGESLDAFWLGKIAPKHVEPVEKLLLRGLLRPPLFLPEFLGRESVQERIRRLRSGIGFEGLFDWE